MANLTTKAISRSAGWAYLINKYFNISFSINIAQLYKCIEVGNISRPEYIQILINAWNANPQHYTEADFRQWVADGYLTAEEFEAITGMVY